MFLFCGGKKENRLWLWKEFCLSLLLQPCKWSGIAHSQLVWRRSIIAKGTVWEIKTPRQKRGASGRAVTLFYSSFLLHFSREGSLKVQRTLQSYKKFCNLYATRKKEFTPFITIHYPILLKFISMCVLIVTHKLCCFWHTSSIWIMLYWSKESRPWGPGFELPSEGAFRVFPSCESLLE